MNTIVLKVFTQFNLQYDLLYLEEYTKNKSFHHLEMAITLKVV